MDIYYDNRISCPLCGSSAASLFYDRKEVFYSCGHCCGLFRPKDTYISAEAEKLRYEEHNNDIYDERYRQFVSPVTSSVFRDFDTRHRGLDFGAGTGPVISRVLEEHGYCIAQYDPFFANDHTLLQEPYHYIVCCEVMEHFHEPYREFELLRDLLLPGGKLYCMTSLYTDGIDFKGWNYKNDPTHVFIYRKETLEWIRKTLGFPGLEIQERLIVFDN